MKCPKCGYTDYKFEKHCTNCGYLFTFEDKWQQIQTHKSLEFEVLIKCGIIAFVIAIIFIILEIFC